MTDSTLLLQFQQLCEASDAVDKIRRLILDLAVRGRLLPQDPNDEPAATLQRRITAAVASGAKTHRQVAASDDEPKGPFPVPPGWVWTRMRRATRDRGQTTPTSDFTYIDVSSIDGTRGVVADPKVLSSADAPSRARKRVATGDVIYSCVRPYLLNVAVIERAYEPAPIVSTAFAVLDGLNLVNPEYLWIALRSPFMVAAVEERMRGQAYPAINDRDFADLPLPLPPADEQQRIVHRVHELLRLCDQLEAAQAARDAMQDRVSAVCLQRITTGAYGDAEVARCARLVADESTRLITTPAHLRPVRQAIIELAVRGWLTAVDEPASDLSVADSPPGWRSVELGQLLDGDTRNGYSRKPDEAASGIPILRISAGTIRADGIVAEDEQKLISGVSSAEMEAYALQRGDLLACRFNGNPDFVGRLALYNGYTGRKQIFPDKLIRVRLNASLAVPSFLRWLSQTSSYRREIQRYAATTVGNWGISAGNLKRISVLLPPRRDQERIVARVAELMSVCAELEAALQVRDARRLTLLHATLEDALAAA